VRCCAHRVWDSDGEFLLIEAAYALPKWARKPEATTHRVFVRGGELRLVPPSVRPRTGAAAAAAAAAPPPPLPPWTLRDGLRAVATDDGARPAACRELLRALTRVACCTHARRTQAARRSRPRLRATPWLPRWPASPAAPRRTGTPRARACRRASRRCCAASRSSRYAHPTLRMRSRVRGRSFATPSHALTRPHTPSHAA
jgi:hypothetical protein